PTSPPSPDTPPSRSRGADPPGAGEGPGDGRRGDAGELGDVVDRHALVRHSAGSVPRLLGTALTGRSPFPGATPEGPEHPLSSGELTPTGGQPAATERERARAGGQSRRP